MPSPAASWRMIRRFKEEVFSDHLLMVASGMAFHGIVGVLPALAAVAVVWGMVLGPEALEGSVDASSNVLPDEAVSLVRQFVTSVPEGLGLGIGLAVNGLFILWTAQRAASGLITALNIVYDERERRGRLHRATVALGIAVGGMGVLLILLMLLALPALLPGDGAMARLMGILRWPALAVIFALALGVLFTVGPSREQPRRQWVSWGAVVSTMLWVAVSYGLSLYVAHAGSFGRYYGSLGAAIVLLMWFYLSALAVLAGGEINALLEESRDRRPRSRMKNLLHESERSG